MAYHETTLLFHPRETSTDTPGNCTEAGADVGVFHVLDESVDDVVRGLRSLTLPRRTHSLSLSTLPQ